MQSRPKAKRAAIGLLVLAAHITLLLLLCVPHRAREQAEAPDNAITVYFVPPARELARQGGRERAEASPSRRVSASASRLRSRREPVLAARPRERSAAPPAAPGSTPLHEPARERHAPIDWERERDQAAQRELAVEDAARDRASMPTHLDGISSEIVSALRPPPPPPPKFDWAPPRVVVRYGTGIFVRLNDHCTLVITVMVLVGCTLDKIPVRGDLFAHMYDDQTPPYALPP